MYIYNEVLKMYSETEYYTNLLSNATALFSTVVADSIASYSQERHDTHTQNTSHM